MLNTHFRNGGPSVREILFQKTQDGWDLLGLTILYDNCVVFEYIINNRNLILLLRLKTIS